MYSFDVYDTIITRKTYEPAGIFDFMSYILQSDYDKWKVGLAFATDFRNIRINAERIARITRSCEITLDKIYETIKETYSLEQYIIDKLLKLELETEAFNTVVIAENVDKIKQLLADNEKVVLISDMYLPRNFFEQIFAAICPELNKLPIYISSEVGSTKTSGLLYKVVKEREHVSYSDWIHIGDNIISDVNIPRLLGIDARHYEFPSDTKALNRLGNICFDVNAVAKQYMLGIAKRVRVERSAAYRVGLTTVGVILFTYVQWIIKQAMQRDFRKLGFIARDGYILKKIADIIIEDENLNIKTVYIYGSRKAWRVEQTEERRLVKSYFVQEFGEDFDDVALVDTQGTARSIDYISNMLDHRFTVFYYVLLEETEDKRVDAIPYGVHYGGSMIEAFCRAPHGSTLAYRESPEGTIIPIIAKAASDKIKKAGYEEYIEGILDFTREILGAEKTCGENLPLIGVANRTLHYCCDCADRELANFIGDIPHDTNNESEMQVFAPLLTKEEVMAIEYTRTSEDIEQVYKGVDIKVSYRRFDEEMISFVDDCKKKYFARNLVKYDDAKQVIIYGFGVYGQELYHRLYCLPNVNVKFVVDANATGLSGTYVDVKTPDALNGNDYDYVVISLLNEKTCEEIREMLIEAGVDREKIIYRKECLSLFDIE